jgi:hypothetical protein
MKLFILTLALTFVSQTFAGNEGGGGGAVVCRYGNEITSVEMLDLFEAPIIHGFKISKNNDIPFREQLKAHLKAVYFPDAYMYLFTEVASEILSKMQFLPDGIILETPDDVGERIPRIMKEGCKLEGLGFYTEERKLLVSKVLFDHLSETDKAAFILHEVFYFLYRTNRAGKDSYLARKAVGYFMIDEPFQYGERPFNFIFKNILAPNSKMDNVAIIPKREKFGWINIQLDKKGGAQWEDGEYKLSCTGYDQGDIIDSISDWGKYPYFIDANGIDVPYCRGIKIDLKDSSQLDKLKIEYQDQKIFEGKPKIPEAGQSIYIQFATAVKLE